MTSDTADPVETVARQRTEVVRHALSWLGTPYHPRAAIKGAGVDCAQLLVEVYVAAGVVAPLELGDYAVDWHLHHAQELYLAHVQAHCTPVAVPAPGDVALFQYGRCISHGGIVVGPDEIVHAYRGLGVVRDRIATHGHLEHRLRGYYTPRVWAEAVT